MHQHSGLANSLKASQIEDDQIFAELERIVGDTSYKMRQDGDATTVPVNARERRRYPLVLISALALVVALVPAGLKKSDLLTRATHPASTD